MATDYNKSYSAETTVEYSETRTTTTATTTGVLDRQYIRGIPVVLKALEVVFGLLGFLLVISFIGLCVKLPGANGFFDFATMFCVVTTVVLYLFRLFQLQIRCFSCCSCIVWPLYELVYYIVCIVLLLIADIILSAVACANQLKAGVAFGWFALVVYIVDMIFAVRIYRQTVHSSTRHEAATTTTTTARY